MIGGFGAKATELRQIPAWHTLVSTGFGIPEHFLKTFDPPVASSMHFKFLL
jgi:hypothetical protein